MSLALLFHAIRGDAAETAALLHAGADPNYFFRTNWYSPVDSAQRIDDFDPWRLRLETETHTGPFARLRTPLLFAAEFGNYDALLLLLDHGADPNHSDDEGVTPCWATAQRGEIRCTEALLRAGGDPNRADTDGQTPLLRAAFKGNLAIVERLLAAGADPNAADWCGKTPLMVATGRGAVPLPYQNHRRRELHSDETERTARIAGACDLLANLAGFKKNLSASTPTPAGDYPAIVRALVQYGADAAAVERLRSPLEGGQTVLHHAATIGCVESIRMLLAAGAPVDVPAPVYGTALSCAIHSKNPEAVGLLLEAGADVNSATREGITPLIGAAMEEDPIQIHLLLDHGADLNALYWEDGVGILHIAAGRGGAAVVAALLARGAEIDSPSSNGSTPLMEAARANKPQTLKTLLAAGANIHARNNYGQTALDCALEKTLAAKMLDKQDDLEAKLLADISEYAANRGPTIKGAAGENMYAEKVSQQARAFWQSTVDKEMQKHAEVIALLKAAGAGRSG